MSGCPTGVSICSSAGTMKRWASGWMPSTRPLAAKPVPPPPRPCQPHRPLGRRRRRRRAASSPWRALARNRHRASIHPLPRSFIPLVFLSLSHHSSSTFLLLTLPTSQNTTVYPQLHGDEDEPTEKKKENKPIQQRFKCEKEEDKKWKPICDLVVCKGRKWLS